MKTALILSAFALLLTVATAQPNAHYMVLYQGSQGLNFYCLDELPYSEARPMLWDNERGAIELSERGELFAQVVQVESCYLDNVYLDPTSDDYYVFRFTSHDTDGHPNHRHITRGIAWIDWIAK